MTAAALSNNIAAFTSPFDAANSNSVVPPPAQLAGGFIPNVDIVKAEQQNYLHGASSTWIYLAQLMGLILPFNPSAGASIVATPKGGIVTVKDNSTGETQWYVAKADMSIGYTDPSLNPTYWTLIDFLKIASQTGVYAAATGTADAVVATFANIVYPVLVEGFEVTVGITALNTTATPTLQVVLNGAAQTARTIVKYISGTAVPLAGGDLQGRCQFSYDLANTRWILLNPASGEFQPGQLIVFAGNTPPSGFLTCPTSQTNLSRTTYAALFSAIGTTWGAGDGSTTFGMPWFAANLTMLQANSNVGTIAHGKVKNHTHSLPNVIDTTNVTGGAAAAGGFYQSITVTGAVLTPEGGADNLAAGVAVLICVKF